ncbi:hypothetical protein DL240_01765 [Lujinxingia litoralis]|uniref:DUF4442 domain-containing protein n=1 Tax=Lujinxingia litoralis TaxID=2211119 RepID=A0A328CA14_9DELT|nr:DUF4442 domain-containing protein [Lujinxingia litoralis]RAL24962.1 hypothetical protein DL240_01765 [Lujinxingia litoralis]
MLLNDAVKEAVAAERPAFAGRVVAGALTTRPVAQAVLWARMPLLALVSPRVEVLNEATCQVDIPFGWRNRNIFGTMYFAASMMAAEMTTGGLVLFHNAVRPERFSYIVRHISADFVKPARSRVSFECVQGDEVARAFAQASRSGERVNQLLEVVGRRADGVETARVKVEWSIKAC